MFDNFDIFTCLTFVFTICRFFSVYDSDRNGLTNAYHENSTFTLSVGLLEGKTHDKKSYDQMKQLSQIGRNLLNDKDISKIKEISYSQSTLKKNVRKHYFKKKYQFYIF